MFSSLEIKGVVQPEVRFTDAMEMWVPSQRSVGIAALTVTGSRLKQEI